MYSNNFLLHVTIHSLAHINVNQAWENIVAGGGQQAATETVAMGITRTLAPGYYL